MERHIDELLNELKNRLLRMSALTEKMIAHAVRMLADRDAAAGDAVDRHEAEVNRMQVEIDEMCLDLIALQQPTASDLRFIIGATKTNAELERLADQAVNVCRKALRLLKAPPLPTLPAARHMAEVASGMVKDSLHAFVSRDTAKARLVLKRDDELDDLKRTLTESLVSVMRGSPASIGPALDLALALRNLERIGDHATNIAENAIFVVEGRDVRHMGAAADGAEGASEK